MWDSKARSAEMAQQNQLIQSGLNLPRLNSTIEIDCCSKNRSFFFWTQISKTVCCSFSTCIDQYICSILLGHKLDPDHFWRRQEESAIRSFYISFYLKKKTKKKQVVSSVGNSFGCRNLSPLLWRWGSSRTVFQSIWFSWSNFKPSSLRSFITIWATASGSISSFDYSCCGCD